MSVIDAEANFAVRRCTTFPATWCSLSRWKHCYRALSCRRGRFRLCCDDRFRGAIARLVQPCEAQLSEAHCTASCLQSTFALHASVILAPPALRILLILLMLLILLGMS